MYSSLAMSIDNSQKGTRYLSFPVYRCPVDQTVHEEVKPPKTSDPVCESQTTYTVSVF